MQQTRNDNNASVEYLYTYNAGLALILCIIYIVYKQNNVWNLYTNLKV